MIHRLRAIAGTLFFAVWATTALATPEEAVNSAAGKVSAVATKVEEAVKHGVQKAASAVEHGASVAGRAVSNTARKLGLPASDAPAAPASSASQ